MFGFSKTLGRLKSDTFGYTDRNTSKYPKRLWTDPVFRKKSRICISRNGQYESRYYKICYPRHVVVIIVVVVMNPAKVLSSLLPSILNPKLWNIIVDYCRSDGDNEPWDYENDQELAFAVSLGYRRLVLPYLRAVFYYDVNAFPLTVPLLNPWSLKHLTIERFRRSGCISNPSKLIRRRDVEIKNDVESWMLFFGRNCIAVDVRDTLATLQYYYEFATDDDVKRSLKLTIQKILNAQ